MLATISDIDLINIDREASIPLLLKRHSGIIFQYAHGFPFKIIPIEDRIQACQIGFMLAIREFDSTKGAALTTFAVWKMRAELSRLKVQDYPWADGRPLEYEINTLSIEATKEPDSFIPPVVEGWQNYISQNEIEKLIEDNTTGLKKRELEIFFHLYGIFGYEEYTQQELAEIMHVSRQRIQQIADSVYKILKHRIVEREDQKDYLT
jgi:RNA polymerase sigma factor (sigma-70 family)